MDESHSSVRRGFFAWTDRVLSQRIPVATVAFHFNLYEGEDAVHVQLMGTDSFVPGEVPERDYWPGSETFTTGEDIFEIPYSVAGEDWQAWLQTSAELARSYIAGGERSGILKSTRGVGMGFVDGDMHVLWQASAV
ncbi:hypothetical protein J2X16_001817 [Pelomonas aquatica]|uniref:Integron-associated effector binding protein domain-containing protein n=1 Tax=Pelomonas aquatica TaxID=431058 RepID=A0ABU1Z790_9BURK|nr:hypothetical protein [Pelomonas aquatica]